MGAVLMVTEYIEAETCIVYRPIIQGQSICTPEEFNNYRVCRNCNEIYQHHLDDGSCAFSPTKFYVKFGKRLERTTRAAWDPL